MKAWTDYPFEQLGDTPFVAAPIREVTVLSYDNNKYCKILVCGVEDEVKRGYLYPSPARCGEVPCLTVEQLKPVAEGE